MTRNEAVKPGAIRPQRQLQRFQKARRNLFTSFFFFLLLPLPKRLLGEGEVLFFFFLQVLTGTWHQEFPFSVRS